MAILDTSARRRFQRPTTRGITSADLFALNERLDAAPPFRPGGTREPTPTARPIPSFGGFLGEDPGANLNPGPRPRLPAPRPVFNAPIPFTRPQRLPEVRPSAPPVRRPQAPPPAAAAPAPRVPGAQPAGARPAGARPAGAQGVSPNFTADVIKEIFGADPEAALLGFLNNSGLAVGDQRFLRGRAGDLLQQFRQSQGAQLAGGTLPGQGPGDFFRNFNFQRELGRFSPASRGFGAPGRTRFSFG